MTRRPARRPARRGPRPARRRSAVRWILDLALAGAVLGALALFVVNYDAPRQTLAGQARIGDGDSLQIGETRIRLEGIDAPEYNQLCDRQGVAYPCGRHAREALARLVQSGDLSCEGWRHDRYGRLLARCFAGDIDVNKAMVEQGWAVAYGDYDGSEREARDAARGLWAGSFEPPREWRRIHGGLFEAEHDGLSRLFDWLTAWWSGQRLGEDNGRGETE